MELLPDDHVVVPACDQVTIAGHPEVDRRKEIEHGGDDQTRPRSVKRRVTAK